MKTHRGKRPRAVNTQISTLVTPSPPPTPATTHYASLVYNPPSCHPSSAV